MLRFSVDFLWISVSEWTVRFSLCLEQKCLQASATHLDTALTLWFMWNDLESISVGSFYPSAQQINQFLHVPSNHGSKILRQTDEEAQTSQVGFSGSFSKESRACLCAPELLLGTAQHWEGLASITWTIPPSLGCWCWCSHYTGWRRMAEDSSEIRTTSRILP